MTKFIQDVFARIIEQVVVFSPKLLASIFIFLVFYVIALVLTKVVVGLAHKADPDRTRVFNLFGTIIKAVTIIIGLITALGTLGIDVTAMVAGLGLSGFALGFALKDAISNRRASMVKVSMRGSIKSQRSSTMTKLYCSPPAASELLMDSS